MRGDDIRPGTVMGYVDVEQWIPQDHPLRRIREMVDRALEGLCSDFEALYSRIGRPSIPPERLLRGLLLQALYGVRSEEQLMQQIKFNLLFRWFVGLDLNAGVWDASVFSKNRDRLMQTGISQGLLQAVVEQARAQNLLSEEHFTVDGTLLEAWASRRSFQPKDPPPTAGTGARGRKCLRDTHESKTDWQARLYKKSSAGEVKPSYLGHVIVENRRGLVLTACATCSSTTAEREAALTMLDELGLRPGSRLPNPRVTLGADKLYQEENFIAELRKRGVVPHVAEYQESAHWPNFLTPAERSDPGFAISQRKRRLVEIVWGWGKLDSIMRKVKLQGLKRVDWFFRLLATVHNLVRMVKLIPA